MAARKPITSILIALWLLLGLAFPMPCLAGMVTFSFDDGLTSIYEEAFPILKNYNLRATVGVVLDRVESENDDYMDVKQLLVLQKNGWEIASHGLTHKRPIDIPVTLSEEVVTGWEVEDKFPCRCVYETKYHYGLVAGLLENDRSLKKFDTLAEVARNPGSYYFDQLIGALHVHSHQPINNKDLVVRSISYQRELRDSQKGLEDRGFHVRTFVSPYNYWTEETRALSKYYYAQAANGGESPNYKDSYDPHWLKRYVVHTLGSADEVIRLLQKKLAASDSWVILCFHGIEDDTGWEPWSGENLERLAQWLQEQGIKVVTIAEGAAIFGANQ